MSKFVLHTSVMLEVHGVLFLFILIPRKNMPSSENHRSQFWARKKHLRRTVFRGSKKTKKNISTNVASPLPWCKFYTHKILIIANDSQGHFFLKSFVVVVVVNINTYVVFSIIHTHTHMQKKDKNHAHFHQTSISLKFFSELKRKTCNIVLYKQKKVG
jgi:hypothetical protein